MKKLSSGAYSYTVCALADGSLRIDLVQTATGRRKIFQLATGQREAMLEHLDSLTDPQCEWWFLEEERERKQAARIQSRKLKLALRH